jgi:hypothetical protein
VVRQQPKILSFVSDSGTLDCTPGEKTSVNDANGSATRSCGWDGKAFVVTLKPERGATREDRYALEADGARLVHTTTLKGGRMPEVSLRRVYVKAPH